MDHVNDFSPDLLTGSLMFSVRISAVSGPVISPVALFKLFYVILQAILPDQLFNLVLQYSALVGGMAHIFVELAIFCVIPLVHWALHLF